MQSPEEHRAPPSREITIVLTWNPARLSDFSQILQRGIKLRARLGTSIRNVLCDQFGVDHDYLDKRINTIFLDGKAVDDVDSSTIREGSVLALSAAMPGFVGAAFRKGGYYSAMRGAISHTEAAAAKESTEGFFTMKLYNMVTDELGPMFLESGIWLEWGNLQDFLRSRPGDFWEACTKCEVEGWAMDPGYILERHETVKASALVHLTVQPAG
jgi:hypothetical protein